MKQQRLLNLAVSGLLGLSAVPAAAATINVTSDITADTTWTANNEYILTKVIYVGTTTPSVTFAKLTIEPGTVIKGEPESAAGAFDPGTLVVTRNGEIDAQGTPGNPIIFTSTADTNPKTAPRAALVTSTLTASTTSASAVVGVNSLVGVVVGGSVTGAGIPAGATVVSTNIAGPTITLSAAATATATGVTLTLPNARSFGEWGGVILLGRAPDAEDRFATKPLLLPGTDFIEGLPEPITAGGNFNGVYGGNDPHDSSGVMRYVSIRHGGYNLSANNEINGLTFGGVGDGTLIDYVEVYNNRDDAFEFFGGTVNAKHLISLFCDDDSVDWDEGFCGQIQYVLSVEHQSPLVNSNRAFECDGDDANLRIRPYSVPVVYNGTFIGGGLTTDLNDHISRDEDFMIRLRDNSGGKIYNSIFTEYKRGRALYIEDENASGTVTSTGGQVVNKSDLDSKERLAAGELDIRNNIFWNCAGGSFELVNAAITSGSPTVTVNSTAGVTVGDGVKGNIAGIPTGATVAAVVNATTLTLSANATLTNPTAPAAAYALVLTITPAVTNVYVNTVARYAPDSWDQALLEVLADPADAPANPNNNAIVDPFFTFDNNYGATRDTPGAIKLKPFPFGQVINNIQPATGAFFESAGYKGAFDPSPASTPWTKGWTAGSKLGYYAE